MPFENARARTRIVSHKYVGVFLRTEFRNFLLVGAVATAAQYGLLIAQVRLLALRPALASTIAYAASSALNYWLNYRFTFASSRKHRIALAAFTGVSTVGAALNFTVMWIANEQLAAPYIAAQILATATTLIWNYLANRRWTF